MPKKNTGSWSGTRVSFPPADRAKVLERDPVCRCRGCKHCTPTGCTAPSDEADHVTAVANGGSDDWRTNGQGLCSGCHLVKTLHEATSGAAEWRRRNPRR